MRRSLQLDSQLSLQQTFRADTSEKVREDRVRRIFARQGYRLTKSNRRDPRAWDYGIYVATHMMASGTDSGRVARFFPTLDDAEQWALRSDRSAEFEDTLSRPTKDWEKIGTAQVGANWVNQLGAPGGHLQHMKVLRGHDGMIRFIKIDPADT